MNQPTLQPSSRPTLRLKGISAQGSACLAEGARLITLALKELCPCAGQFLSLDDLNACKTPRAAHSALKELLSFTQTLIKGTFALIPRFDSLDCNRQNQITALSEAAGNTMSYLQMAITELGPPSGRARNENAFLACLQTSQRLYELVSNSNGLFPGLQKLAESSPLFNQPVPQTESPDQQIAAPKFLHGRTPGISPILRTSHPPLIASYISNDHQLETSMPILDAFVLIGGRLVNLDAVTAGKYWQTISLPRCSEVTYDIGRHSMLRLEGHSAAEFTIPIGLKYNPVAASAVLSSGAEVALDLTNCSLSGRYRVRVPEDSAVIKIQIERSGSPKLPTIELWQRANSELVGTALPQHGAELAGAVADALACSRLVYTQDPRIAALFKASGANRLAVFDGLRAGNCETFAALLAHKLQQNGIGALVTFGGVFDAARRGVHCSPGHAQVLCAGGLFDLTAHTSALTIDESPRAELAISEAKATIAGARDSLEAFQIAQRLGDEVICNGERAQPQTSGVRFKEIRTSKKAGKTGRDGSGSWEQPSDIELQLAISLLSSQIDEPLRLVQRSRAVNWARLVTNLTTCYCSLKQARYSPTVVQHFSSCGITAKITLLFHEANNRGLVDSAVAQHFVTTIGEWMEQAPLLAYAMIPAALALPEDLLRNPGEPLITKGPYGHIGGALGDPPKEAYEQRVLVLQLFEKLLQLEDSRVIREYAREELIVGTSLLSSSMNGPEYSQKAAELFGQVVKIVARGDRDIYDVLLRGLKFINSSELPMYLKQARRSPIASRWFTEDGSLSEYGRVILTKYTLGELLRKPSRSSTRSSPLQLIAVDQDRDDGELGPVIRCFQLDLSAHRDAITHSVISWVTHLKASIGRLWELMPCPVDEAPFGAWLRYKLHNFEENGIIAGVVGLQELGLINPYLLQQHWPLASEASAAKVLATSRIYHRSPNDHHLTCTDGPLENNELHIGLYDLSPTLVAEWVDSGQIGREPLGQIAAARRLLGVVTRKDMECQKWRVLYPDTWKALAKGVESIPREIITNQAMTSLLDHIPHSMTKRLAITVGLLNSLPLPTTTPSQALADIAAFLAKIDRTSATSINNLRQTTDITIQGAVSDAEFLALTAVPKDCYQIAHNLVNDANFQSYFTAPQDWHQLRSFWAIFDIPNLAIPASTAESRQIATMLARAKRFAGQASGQAGIVSSRVASSRGRSRGGPESTLGFERHNYTPGDDIRRLDWRTSARLDKLIVRAFERDPLYQQPRLEIHLELQRLAQSGSAGIFAELTSVAELFFRHSCAIKLRLFFRGSELPVAGLPEIADPRHRSERALMSGFVTLARLAQNALKISSIFGLPVPLYGSIPSALTALAQASQKHLPCQVLALPASTNIHKTQLQVASFGGVPNFEARVI